MNSVEQVKESINGLSISDQSDVLIHVLRLRYQVALAEIKHLAKEAAPLHGQTLVDNLSYDELLEQLHLLEGIREGLQDVAQGNKNNHESVKSLFDQWRKK